MYMWFVAHKQVPGKLTTEQHGLIQTISSTCLQNVLLQLSDISSYLTRLIFKLLPKSPISLISQKKSRVHLTGQKYSFFWVSASTRFSGSSCHRKARCPFFTPMDHSPCLVPSSPALAAGARSGFRAWSGCLLLPVTRSFSAETPEIWQELPSFPQNLQHCSKDSPGHEAALLWETKN